MSITLLIMLATTLISWQSWQNRELFLKVRHYPYLVRKDREFYRLLTSGFVHASWLHLGVNMYVLWVFGEQVEQRLMIEFGVPIGRVVYLGIYLVTIVLANIPSTIKKGNNPNFGSVGASGGISGIVFIFILFYPWSTLLLFFIIPLPAILAGILFLGYSTYASNHMQDNIDHDAHFFGAVSGLFLMLLIKPSLFFTFVENLITAFPF